jgi:hypothetical protein
LIDRGAAESAAAPKAFRQEHRVMAVKLNQRSYEYAQKLIQNRQCVLDQRSDWTDHQPSRQSEKKMIDQQGWAEFRRWHLGEDDELSEHSKSRYKFPYGDFVQVHRCAVLAAEARAGQYKYTDIELAAAHLHGMLDELMALLQSKSEERGRVSSL